MKGTLCRNMQKHLQNYLVKIRKNRAEIMSDENEIRQRYDAWCMIIMWNAVTSCEELRTRKISNN